MRNRVKFVAYVLAPVLLLVALAPQTRAAGRDQFEGKWAIEVTPEDGGKPYRDTIVFKNLKLTSEKLKKEGFEETEYEVDTRGAQIGTFTATAKTKPEGGEAKWSGTATLGNLKGTLVVTTKKGGTVNYNFTGAKADR
jgi:hypothetical protein